MKRSRFALAQGSPGQRVTKGGVWGKARQVLTAGDMCREEGGLSAATSGEIRPFSMAFFKSSAGRTIAPV